MNGADWMDASLVERPTLAFTAGRKEEDIKGVEERRKKGGK